MDNNEPESLSDSDINTDEPLQLESDSQSSKIENASSSSSSYSLSSDSFLFQDFSSYYESIIISVIVIVGAISAYFIIHYFLQKTADSLNLKDRKIKGIDSLVKTIITVLTVIIIIFQFSTLSGSLAGALSVAVGTVIGFSSRNSISNAIAGMILLSARPFKLGDRITIVGNDSLIGDVVEISLICTKIKTIKNELVTIPNQTLLQNQIMNYSGFNFLATAVEVSVGYDYDIYLVKELLIKGANDTPGIVSQPKPYTILKRLDDFAAVYELRSYTNEPNLFLRIADIRENIYKIFQRNGIDLTTPRIVTSAHHNPGNIDKEAEKFSS
jgi:small-conductance mechanosensitive channel